LIFINPYKKGSSGARSLRSALVAKGHRTLIGQKAPLSQRALVINWGNSEFTFDPLPYKNIVNLPPLVGVMTNKLRFFRHVGHSRMVPEWSTEAPEACKWGGRVVVRHKLEGSGGAGIEIVEDGNPLPKAPLYVKYENKTHEFRIHMARGLHPGDPFNPILVQRKIFQKRPDMEKPKDWAVRNHDNGFIFVRESDYPTPEAVLSLATNFMNEHFSRLHFAALDIVWHDKRKQGFVLEGNTAPGLEGNTIEVYSNYFSGLASTA